MSFRIAILGSRGIGFFHTRIFHQLGHQICGVLGSSKPTAELAAESLKDAYGIVVKPYSNLNKLLLFENPDVVSICTPPQLHLPQLIKILDKEKPVFCEKPIFWHNGITHKEVMNYVKRLNKYSRSILHVNTSNASLIKNIKSQLDSIRIIKNFTFEFHTNSSFKGYDIAVDLLPHGISMLLELFGLRKITRFSHRVKKNSYNCKFNFGNCSTEFKFMSGKNIEKKLQFSINDYQFLRVQQNLGNKNFNVALKDLKHNELIKIEDPFENYIKRFLKFSIDKDYKNREITQSAFDNITLMADILLK